MSSAAGLRIIGDDVVPEEITRVLGCEPTSTTVKGQVIRGKKTGQERIARTGSWHLDVPDRGNCAVLRDCPSHKDSSLVSFSDNAEVERVRTRFLKGKLGLTNPDAELDQAIKAVGETMKSDRTRNRVTVYYLLADRFGKLSQFA